MPCKCKPGPLGTIIKCSQHKSRAKGSSFGNSYGKNRRRKRKVVASQPVGEPCEADQAQGPSGTPTACTTEEPKSFASHVVVTDTGDDLSDDGKTKFIPWYWRNYNANYVVLLLR